MPSPDQITLIEQLKSQGKTLVEIAAIVGMEMGDVESVVDMAEVPLATGGGVTQVLAGDGISVSPSNGEGVVTVGLASVTVTVPSAWILANTPAVEGVNFEVIPGVAGKSIVLFGAVATLRFNTAAYTGSTSDTDLGLFYGTDPFTAALVNDSIPQGFWDATSDASSPILPLPSNTQPNVLGLPISFLLNGQGFADGDSDVDITAFYALA